MAIPIVLASTSVFRQQQLRTLGVEFVSAKPFCDETPLPNEAAHHTALRLATTKAQSLRSVYPQHLIIGADQVAWCRQQQWGKPLTTERAAHMLVQLSGQSVHFYSALCVFNSVSGSLKTHVDTTIVHMRTLSASQIQHYLAREPEALYCAGAAKSEGLGAALIDHIDSSDPHALVGLPIFKLIDFLNQFGISVL